MSNIDSLRREIDEITSEMLRLYRRRVGLSTQMGTLKKDAGRDVMDDAREARLRANMLALSAELGLAEDLASRFINFLLIESLRIQSDNKNTHLSIFKKAKELEAAGRKMIHMEVGEPDFMPPRQVSDAMHDLFDRGFVRYGSPWGRDELRKALAVRLSELHGLNLGPGNILVTPGARFSVFLSVTALLNPGDEVIIIEPAWPAYVDCASHAGVKVRRIHTRLEDDWEPDPQAVRDLVNDNTRMMILNYPNNPTGKVLPVSLQDELVSIAVQNGLYVLSDEIYSMYCRHHKSIMEYGYSKSIVIQSFSKSHAMTGFRMGYAVADNAILGTMASLQGLCLTSVPDPMQYAALAALDADVSGNTALLESRLDMLAGEAGRMGLEFAVPDGAMYVFARVPSEGFDGTVFAHRALEEGLAVAPGEGFGAYRDFIRLSACSDKKTLKEGMFILNDMLMRRQ